MGLKIYSMASQVEISIIIPSKDRPGHIKACVQSIEKASKASNIEIIIVHDGDFRPSFHQKYISEIKNPSHGVASGRNAGAKEASGHILLFIDDDMIINENALQHVRQFFRGSYEKKMLMVNWQYPPELLQFQSQNRFLCYLEHIGFTSLKGKNPAEAWEDNTVFETSHITSQFLACIRAHFLSSGGYDENFPFAGAEDYEFAHRLRNECFRFFIDSRVCIHHNESDRIHLLPWLARQVRGGITRRFAVNKGLKELKVHYPLHRLILLQTLYIIKPLLIILTNVFEKLNIPDSLLFRFYDTLYALAIFEGFTIKYKQIGKKGYLHHI